MLDGQYEIISQRPLTDGQTLFRATAPDGTNLNILWYELTTPQLEAQFERYRQLLRTLRKGDQAAIYDIVARPGATYVAWHAANGLPKAPPSAELQSLFEAFDYDTAQADIRQGDDNRPRIYGVALSGTLPLTDEPPPEQLAPAQRMALSRIPAQALSWGLCALLVGISLALLSLSLDRLSNNRVVTIPELAGTDINSAAERLNRLNLAVNAEAVTSDAPPFSVLASEPPAGTTLRPGFRRVTLRYSVPPGQQAMTTVPQLLGRTFDGSIQATLEQNALELGAVAFVHSNSAAGQIIGQSVSAGTSVSEGETVHLLVSEGRRGTLTFVPDLTGLPLEDAEYLARTAGLTLAEPDRVRAPSALPGTVISQNIAPYTTVVAEESTLRLIVAGASEEALSDVGTPYLIGLTLESARQVAADYTLIVDELTNPNESLNLPEGIVNQEPAPGSNAATRTIRVLYNVHPRVIPIPSVSAVQRAPEPRSIPYAFTIESNITVREAEVIARTIDDRELPVYGPAPAQGGDRISGVWVTDEITPFRFVLNLNGFFYTESGLIVP